MSRMSDFDKKQQTSASAEVIFCSLCNRFLNSEFQRKQHFEGRSHLQKAFSLGIKPEKTASDLDQSVTAIEVEQSTSAERSAILNQPVKGKRINNVLIPNAKKPELCLSSSSKAKAALFVLYRKGFRMRTSGQAPLFTSSIKFHSKMYSASGPSKCSSQLMLAQIIANEFERWLKDARVPRAVGKLKRRKLNAPKANVLAHISASSCTNVLNPHLTQKIEEDFTSNADIFSCPTFRAFNSQSVFKPMSDVTKGSEETIAASETTAAPPCVSGKPVIALVDMDSSFTSIKTLNNTTSNAAFAPEETRKTSIDVLEFVCPGTQWVTKTEVETFRSGTSVPGDPVLEFSVIAIVNGEAFEGRSTEKRMAMMYAADAAIVKLLGLKLQHSQDEKASHQDNEVEMVGLNEKQNEERMVKDCASDGDPVLLLNKLYDGDVAFTFYERVASKWGLEHRCTVSVEGMTIEGRDLLKAKAKQRAAYAAVAALKANGMYDRRVAEKNSLHSDQPKKKRSRIVAKQAFQNAAKQLKGVPMVNADSQLTRLFPGCKYTVLTKNCKGLAIHEAEVHVEGQTFHGHGGSAKAARLDVAENALRTLGLWTADDEKMKARNKDRAEKRAERHVERRIERRNEKKRLAKAKKKCMNSVGQMDGFSYIHQQADLLSQPFVSNSVPLGNTSSICQGRAFGERDGWGKEMSVDSFFSTGANSYSRGSKDTVQFHVADGPRQSELSTCQVGILGKKSASCLVNGSSGTDLTTRLVNLAYGLESTVRDDVGDAIACHRVDDSESCDFVGDGYTPQNTHSDKVFTPLSSHVDEVCWESKKSKRRRVLLKSEADIAAHETALAYPRRTTVNGGVLSLKRSSRHFSDGNSHLARSSTHSSDTLGDCLSHALADSRRISSCRSDASTLEFDSIDEVYRPIAGGVSGSNFNHTEPIDDGYQVSYDDRARYCDHDW